MPRASRQVRQEVERRFPVRVRIAVPPGGLGRQLAIMHAWLDETGGALGWMSAPSGVGGIVNDAIAFYFADTAFAQAFVARFCCGWRIATVADALAVRAEPAPARTRAAAHKPP